ncbi:hypothetical protein MF672_011270 [Actinomadura sp. ATCC 31491]|uniref:Uncharacterized protein n=1 Tax=Actinomadura luzonensis TaxID=2805427 RepID=A0ABT0FPW7_9ACTN|nr:hypothetical protein [Actinomadura luzonensis]MCK2214367.1 hypothetical protein [Actinomadura luzonensis]
MFKRPLAQWSPAKRRLAVLGAVCALAVAGLSGSALADQPASPAPGGKVTCTTVDGGTIELTAPKPGERVKARVHLADELPEGAEPPAGVEPGERIEAHTTEAAEADAPDAVHAVPALPAVPDDGSAPPKVALKAPAGKPGKAVGIICKKPE